jgi:hypothetical protein
VGIMCAPYGSDMLSSDKSLRLLMLIGSSDPRCWVDWVICQYRVFSMAGASAKIKIGTSVSSSGYCDGPFISKFYIGQMSGNTPRELQSHFGSTD